MRTTCNSAVPLWGCREEDEECSDPPKAAEFPSSSPIPTLSRPLSLPWEFSHPIWALQRHPLVEIQVFSSPESSWVYRNVLLDSKCEWEFYREKMKHRESPWSSAFVIYFPLPHYGGLRHLVRNEKENTGRTETIQKDSLKSSTEQGSITFY